MRLLAVVASACAIVSISGGVARSATISSTAQLTLGYSTIDFESYPAGTTPSTFSIGDATFSNTTAAMAIADTLGGPGTSGNGLWVSTTTKIEFASPISEILMTWLDPNFSNSFEAYDSADNLLESAAVPSVGGGASTLFGLKRTSADISYVLAVIPVAETIVFDNLHYNAVPEPSSLALAGLGLIAIGGCAMRRKNKMGRGRARAG